jgi:hypothetical protein
MNTPTEPPIWVAIGSDGTISAHDTLDGAENTLRDDDGDVWIECVTLQRDTHAPERPPVRAQRDEHDANAAQPGPTPQTGSHRRSWIAPPALTIRGAWVDPWGGGDAA